MPSLPNAQNPAVFTNIFLCLEIEEEDCRKFFKDFL
nr:MAG TPA: hypothetical protein [Caudoviricetes sp.]DAI64726.1 MAG TPA: hypothetical protein [Caudoviricetes sp.]